MSLRSMNNELNEIFFETIDEFEKNNITVSLELIRITKFKTDYIAVIVYVKPKDISFSKAKEDNKLCLFIKVFKEKNFKITDSLVKKITVFINNYKYNQKNYGCIIRNLYPLFAFHELSLKMLSDREYRATVIITLLVMFIVVVVLAHSGYKVDEAIRSLFEI
ncbi:MAG: hypothetical protein ACI4GY_05055 [Acutalibacteraceae bacterium]